MFRGREYSRRRPAVDGGGFRFVQLAFLASSNRLTKLMTSEGDRLVQSERLELDS